MSRGFRIGLVAVQLVSAGCSKHSESTSTTLAPSSSPTLAQSSLGVPPPATNSPPAGASSSGAASPSSTTTTPSQFPSSLASAPAAGGASAGGTTPAVDSALPTSSGLPSDPSPSASGQGGSAASAAAVTDPIDAAGGTAPLPSASGAGGAAQDGGSGATAYYKPRLINTTDLGGDPDDQQSMVRQLVSANEFELEGLIVSTSCWKKTQSSTAMLDTIVDAYGAVLSNLRQHAEGYPSLEYLRSISVLGNTGYAMAEVGEGKQSAGADLIIRAADKDDARPLWVTCWGGCNTLAQAVWTVQQTRSASELSRFLSKLRVYDVLGQDDSGAWLVKNYPDLFYIRGTGVYGWAPSDTWLDEHVQSHGALGAVYPDTMYDTEGDTQSFMYLYPNGLHDPERVEQGGWGGRFDGSKQAGVRGMEPVTNEAEFDPYRMYTDTEEGAASIARWRPAYDNDFEARMDWSQQANYADANHHPIAVVQQDETRDVLTVSASAGAEVTLDAAGSSDPDADALAYAWSFYAEPSTYAGQVTLQNATSSAVTLTVPADAAGTTLHLVLELHDDGTPNLYAYRRVILGVQ